MENLLRGKQKMEHTGKIIEFNSMELLRRQCSFFMLAVAVLVVRSKMNDASSKVNCTVFFLVKRKIVYYTHCRRANAIVICDEPAAATHQCSFWRLFYDEIARDYRTDFRHFNKAFIKHRRKKRRHTMKKYMK